MAAGIYAIVNTRNGMRYVGQAIDIEARWNEHRRALRAGNHCNARLQNAWNKYGEKAFEFCIVDTDVDLTCRAEESRLSLILAEQFWMDTLGRWHGMLYNIAPTAGSRLGAVESDATRRKKSAAKRGNTYNRGRKHKPETLANMSAAQRGKEHPQDCLHCSASRGKKRTDAARAKMAAANRHRGHKRRGIASPNCPHCPAPI
jgi:group I intron endonuclease